MKRIVYIIAALLIVSCGTESEFDAQGTFEATEVIISSEAAGRILNFDIEEGMSIERGELLAEIDSVQLHLQRSQLDAQLLALLNSRPDIQTQVASLREQIATLKVEQRRIENMLRDGAATEKQKDDIDALNVDKEAEKPLDIQTTVGFNIGKSEVNPIQRGNLIRIAKVVNDNDLKITIVGYADKATGSDERNMELSKLRAESVANELKKLGVKEDSITINGMGSSEQVFDENDANRVVIFTVDK